MANEGTIRRGPGFERRRASPAAPAIDSGIRRSHAAFVERLREAGLADGRVLAIALDSAPLERALHDAGYEAAGMDHAPDAEQIAEAHPDSTEGGLPWPVRLGDASARVPWPAATFDAVVLADVLEHVEDDLGVVLEVKRVLRPGGRVLVGCKNAGGLLARVFGARWSFRRDPLHLRPYDVPALVALFAYQGFRVRRWGTYFDLYRAGESTKWLAPLNSIGGIAPGLGIGESAVLVVEKPLLDVPAWNQKRV